MRPRRVQEYCPVCWRLFEKSCKCLCADMKCPAGHWWHHCPVHGTVILGQAPPGGRAVAYACCCPPAAPAA